MARRKQKEGGREIMEGIEGGVRFVRVEELRAVQRERDALNTEHAALLAGAVAMRLERNALQAELEATKTLLAAYREDDDRMQAGLSIERGNRDAYREQRDALQAEIGVLKVDLGDALMRRDEMAWERNALQVALTDLVRDAQAAVDQDNPFLGKQLNDLAWNTIPAARRVLEESGE
jgi:chromosome segregation ATPase